MQKTSLVTGGAGFIGAHVVRALLAKGDAVVALDDLSGGFLDVLPAHPALTFVRGDILDASLIEKLFTDYRFDYVYHFAAYAAEGLSHFIKRFNYQNNLIGSINLINAAVSHEIKCFVFTSSIAVYGSLPPPVKEETPPRPDDPYGVAKFAVEMELRVTHELFGLPYIIFRPHNVYGEFQNIGDRYRNVVGIFMNQLMQGSPLTIFGDGSQTRAFSYIGDVAPLLAAAVDTPAAYNEIFNVGADTPYSVRELAVAVMEAMDIKGALRNLPARVETLHAYADHSKARDVFGPRKPTPLQEGLAQMANWAKSVGARKSKPFAAIEIEKDLPEIWREPS